jgi:hypothetical protein
MQSMYYIGLDVHKRTISYCAILGERCVAEGSSGTVDDDSSRRTNHGANMGARGWRGADTVRGWLCSTTKKDERAMQTGAACGRPLSGGAIFAASIVVWHSHYSHVERHLDAGKSHASSHGSNERRRR